MIRLVLNGRNPSLAGGVSIIPNSILQRYWRRPYKKTDPSGISLKGVIEEELVDYIEKEQSKPMTPLDRITRETISPENLGE